MLKKIVFIFGGVKRGIRIFNTNSRKLFAYKIFSEVFRENNLKVYFSKVHFYEKGVFRGATYFEKGKKKFEDVVPDLVHPRSTAFSSPDSLKFKEIQEKFTIVNSPTFECSCDNKYINYLMFNKYYLKTIFIQKGMTIDEATLKELNSERIVAKPNVGSSGKGVFISSKKDVLAKSKSFETDMILQEYIDSSDGVPGIVEGVHDFRITIVGNQIFYAYLKVPGGNSLLCNVAQGGRMIFIDNSEIPSEVKNICDDIVNRLSGLKTVSYSIDLARNKDGKYKLIEMNSRPGILFNEEEGELQKKYYDAVAKRFLALIEGSTRND